MTHTACGSSLGVALLHTHTADYMLVTRVVVLGTDTLHDYPSRHSGQSPKELKWTACEHPERPSKDDA